MSGVMEVVVRSAYLYDADEVSEETATVNNEPSMTVQSEKDSADINVILERFGITGQLPQNVRPPTFQDFGDTVFDFRSAVEAIAMAEDSFMSMPARVRAEFENDPQKFVEFCSEEKNLPRMRELGLAVPEKLPAKPEASGSGGNPQ